MPRYFFHTRIGDEEVVDPAGTELRDPDRAWDAAHAIVRATMSASDRQARLIGACLVVTDEVGDVVFEFPFAEAMVASRGTDDQTGGLPH